MCLQRSCIAIFGALLIAGALTALLIVAISQSLLVRWQRAPLLPAPLAAPLTVREARLYVTATDGMIYSADLLSDTRWRAELGPPAEDSRGYPAHAIEPCQPDEPIFRWYTFPPSRQASCFVAATRYADGGTTVSVLVEDPRTLSYIHRQGSAYDGVGLILFVLPALTIVLTPVLFIAQHIMAERAERAQAPRASA